MDAIVEACVMDLEAQLPGNPAAASRFLTLDELTAFESAAAGALPASGNWRGVQTVGTARSIGASASGGARRARVAQAGLCD